MRSCSEMMAKRWQSKQQQLVIFSKHELLFLSNGAMRLNDDSSKVVFEVKSGSERVTLSNEPPWNGFNKIGPLLWYQESSHFEFRSALNGEELGWILLQTMKIQILLAACFVAAASGKVLLFEYTKEKVDDSSSTVGNLFSFGLSAKSDSL